MDKMKTIQCSTDEPVDKGLLTILATCFSHLIEAAENNDERVDIVTAAGELEVFDTDYQIQLQFISNKQAWVNPDSVRFTESTVKFNTDN